MQLPAAYHFHRGRSRSPFILLRVYLKSAKLFLTKHFSELKIEPKFLFKTFWKLTSKSPQQLFFRTIAPWGEQQGQLSKCLTFNMQKYSGDDLIDSPEPDFLCDANWFFLGIFFPVFTKLLKFDLFEEIFYLKLFKTRFFSWSSTNFARNKCRNQPGCLPNRSSRLKIYVFILTLAWKASNLLST